MWDAIVTSPIPELGAEPDDIVIVRPEHPEYPVLVVHRYGPEALILIRNHRRCLWSRQKDAGKRPTPQSRL